VMGCAIGEKLQTPALARLSEAFWPGSRASARVLYSV
jgi:hypothetical protein